MWPGGHLAFGYVLYSLGTRARTRAPPTDLNALALAVGTQFPDLVDKPLAWWVGILPGGRTLAHSLVVMLPLLAVLALLARRVGHTPQVTAFGIGYGSHLVGDALGPLLVGSYSELAFFLWPLTPTVIYDSEPSFVWHFASISLTPMFIAELGLGIGVVGLWLVDGSPGIGTLRKLVRRDENPK